MHISIMNVIRSNTFSTVNALEQIFFSSKKPAKSRPFPALFLLVLFWPHLWISPLDRLNPMREAREKFSSISAVAKG